MSKEEKRKKLIDRIIKSSKGAKAYTLDASPYFGLENRLTLDIPALNIALSGEVDKGRPFGLHMIAGESKMFKSTFALLEVAEFLRQFPEDGVVVFYDSEFGAPASYFARFGIDTSRVIHKPITNVEILKNDLVNLLDDIEDGDNVFILVDSIGNTASIKELEDAKDEKSVADMTRAKALKGMFRMITPFINIKRVYMTVVNHTYKEIGLFPKDIVGGGTGSYYASNSIWIVSRRQIKEGTEISGYTFNITIEKSRFVKERVKIPIEVTYDGGLLRETGLQELAIEFGYIIQSGAWYQTKDLETGQVSDKKCRASDITWDSYYAALVEHKPFKDAVRNKYKLEGSE